MVVKKKINILKNINQGSIYLFVTCQFFFFKRKKPLTLGVPFITTFLLGKYSCQMVTIIFFKIDIKCVL
jgi:hypothetical protein